MVVVAHGVDRGSELAAASEEDDGYSTSTTDDDDDDAVEPHGPASSGLLWVPYAAAVSAVRALLGASHHDLRLRAHQLSRSLSAVFFFAGAGLGPEGAVLVCADVPPLGPALRDAQRAMVRVAAEEADHAACDCYYDAVRDAMRLLVGDAGLFRSSFSSHWVFFSNVEFQSRFRGYNPFPAVAAASALRWVPHAAAVSAVRALLGASHEDLRLRVHHLSRSLSGAFFAVGAAAAPFASGARFPEGKLFVCADLLPLGPALVAAQRAMMQVAVKDASHGPCDWYFDTVGELMRLLVGDTGVGPAVFDRASFESAFALEWEN
ncbi:uncharacterized protein LOC127784552 [Oryza glaberrima]|uniref:Uncharacterized protein n=1 Tax=Oryza glaberrima TaxID=4538 RepID=I1QP70_ORYGL|nr:uncharacterized protein LOC127784552 [Oryza glaberrima]